MSGFFIVRVNVQGDFEVERSVIIYAISEGVMSCLDLKKLASVGGAGLLLTLLMALVVATTLAGCADKSKKQELLARDYLSLPNDELLLYYYQLEDQIVAEERSSSGVSVGVGLGMGSFGGGSIRSGGIGVSTGTGSRAVASDLRDRRNEVRIELQKRGIAP